MNLLNKRTMTILSLLILAVITRLLPHPPNVAPITGMALFAGSTFNDKRLAFILPLLCMFVTDIFLGFHMIIPFVYLSFMFISYLGIRSEKITNGTILGSSLIFFLISNFGVWLLGYPHTLTGLISCYTLAIPFFANTIIGDLFFTHSLSYSFNKLEKKYPVLT
ncbi:hypothetical protein HOE22_03575 [Candidatus Woesearchaeota archaeon]|nr:hypothetical protein [Candidatus Woesearchaeota archaeon]